ncbi:magnesium and cobalt transport protein CorA [Mycolicibacter minnesotensis]
MTAVGDRKPRVLVDCGVYTDGARIPGEFTPAAALAKVYEIESSGNDAFVWVGLHEPTEAQMQGVATTFQLHELSVEDAVYAHQRPKLERYDEHLFLVLKTVNYVQHESVVLPRQIVESGEIMIFVGKNFVVTVRHGDHSSLAEVRKQMDIDPDSLRLGPYAVMHAIADYVVDRYGEVTNLMETDIDVIEEAAFAPDTRTDVEPIYQIKREVLALRRAVAPLSVPFQRLQNEHKDLISKEVRRYLRDVADNQTRVAEQISSYDEMLSALVQAALARVGMQQNTDMRKMSAWAGIIAVPTMIAGIYGMNFDHMPALHWVFSYPLTLVSMATICAVLHRAFRRNGWL